MIKYSRLTFIRFLFSKCAVTNYGEITEITVTVY